MSQRQLVESSQCMLYYSISNPEFSFETQVITSAVFSRAEGILGWTSARGNTVFTTQGQSAQHDSDQTYWSPTEIKNTHQHSIQVNLKRRLQNYDKASR